jgi:tyrosine ammonia-lyase
MSSSKAETVAVGPDSLLTIARLARVVLSTAAESVVRRANRFVEQLIRERRIVYGITTGFGPLLPSEQVVAMMVARAGSLAQGHSGVRPETISLLIAIANARIVPHVPSMGTVGASGDLTPLAHMAGALLGEGEVHWNGTIVPARDALAANGLAALVPGPKEAIALVNGTSTMSGIAALNGAEAHAQLELAIRSALLYAEIMEGRSEAFDPRIGAVRPHSGQARVHSLFADETAARSRLRRTSSTKEELPLATEHTAAGSGVFANRPIIQDPYSVRCIPQLYGAALDALQFHNDIVNTELSSVTDNPILFPDDDTVLQGGNFFGQHVGLASDALTNALIIVAGHVERSVDRLTDPVRSNGLPPMLQSREPGLQSGFMGIQVTATALHAEMRTRATPASIQSISTNAGNQDIVTMGTIAARNTSWHIERLWELLAIQMIVLAQAAELRSAAGSHGDPRAAGFSFSSLDLVQLVRSHIPPLGDDRPLSGEIGTLADVLRGYALDHFVMP